MDMRVCEDRKAIFVDGPSANHIKSFFGIERINFQGLFKVLTELIGTCRVLVHAPIVTIHPERVVYNHGISKDLTGAGFEMLEVTSSRGADDRAIIARIDKLTLADVAEIVIVTSDRDFIPVLQSKATQGIRVLWVSTRHTHPKDKSHHLSRDVLNLCDRGVFKFIEIANYRHLIADRSKSSTPRPQPNPRETSEFTKITLRLNARQQRTHHELVAAVQELTRRFSGLSFTIDE